MRDLPAWILLLRMTSWVKNKQTDIFEGMRGQSNWIDFRGCDGEEGDHTK